MKHAYYKSKTSLITLKRRFINLNRTRNKVMIGCIFVELWSLFCLSAEEGARKLMKPKHTFASPGKTEL